MNKIPNINNYNIDKEHNEIHLLLNKLNELCTKHIIQEEKLLKLRNNIKPENHINIDNEIMDHILEHKLLLKQIESLKNNFINHIKKKDILHFHKI